VIWSFPNEYDAAPEAVSSLLPTGQMLMFSSLRQWRLAAETVKKLPF
jgi:hypothetical protein